MQDVSLRLSPLFEAVQAVLDERDG
jgi:hypothetical protein